MKVNIDIKNDNLFKSIKQFKKELTSNSGGLQSSLKFVGNELLKRAASRYSIRFPRRKRPPGPDVKRAILSSGVQIVQDKSGDTTLFLFDEGVLDRLTKLPPTVVDKRVYSLWRLLSGGWGPLGSSDKSRGSLGLTRTTPYPLYVFVQNIFFRNTDINQSEATIVNARRPPYPELLAKEGEGVYVVRHPGFKGREWFLKNGKMFNRDVKFLKSTVDFTIKTLLKKTGLS